MVLRTIAGGIAVTLTATFSVLAQDVRNTPGPLEKQAKPVTPENPVPRRLTSRDVEYPVEMRASGGRGMVGLQVTLDADGKVAEIRSVSAQVQQPPGPIDSAAERQTSTALAEASIAAVREWTFASPVAAPLTFPVALMFFDGTIDVRIAPPVSPRGRGPGPTAAGTQPPAPWAAAEGAYRVGGALPPPRKTKDARPDYPRAAQEKRLAGVVIMEIVIGPNGKVRDTRVLRSVPELDQAALNTVRKWEYAPTMVGGVAVPVLMTITLTYNLN